jgi:hypothetical protein
MTILSMGSSDCAMALATTMPPRPSSTHRRAVLSTTIALDMT